MFFNISQVSCSRLCQYITFHAKYILLVTQSLCEFSVTPACDSNRPFSLVGFCFPNTYHVTIPRRFEPLSCSLERLHVSMKMSILSWGSSHDLYWQNKIDKRKSSMYLTETFFVHLNEHRKKFEEHKTIFKS